LEELERDIEDIQSMSECEKKIVFSRISVKVGDLPVIRSAMNSDMELF